jgi:DNA-binding IclR family transcriptional regulator
MKKTYNAVQSNYKFIDIMEFLHQQTGPVSGTQIAKALDIPHGTVMSHLQPAIERRWVRCWLARSMRPDRASADCMRGICRA